jgi:hypothetical protein
MPEYPEGTFEEPSLDCDPESDKLPVAPDGTYTNSEHGARILPCLPRTVGQGGDNERTFIDINCIIPNVPGIGSVFARSQPYRRPHTCTEANTGSSWKMWRTQLKLDGKTPADAENLPVVVEVGIRKYVARENQLTPEEREAGMEPVWTEVNYIRNIMAE